MTPAYANRARQRARALPQPRNMKAVQQARDPLVISFIGDAPWSNPTVYCDSGQRYDWSFVQGLLTIIAVRAGVVTRDALPEILGYTDTINLGYPILVDVDLKEVACVVEGHPVGLWQMRQGSELWQQYFEPKT